MTLIIRPIMNSAVEEIFAFKTCCGQRVFDQNLEIQLTNTGDFPVVVPAYFDLEGKLGSRRIMTLMPPGELQILPGETRAFYCEMEERLWEAAEEVVFYDLEGNRHGVRIR